MDEYTFVCFWLIGGINSFKEMWINSQKYSKTRWESYSLCNHSSSFIIFGVKLLFHEGFQFKIKNSKNSEWGCWNSYWFYKTKTDFILNVSWRQLRFWHHTFWHVRNEFKMNLSSSLFSHGFLITHCHIYFSIFFQSILFVYFSIRKSFVFMTWFVIFTTIRFQLRF